MTYSPRSTLADLAEDLETSWVPDVVGRGDFVGLAADPALGAEDVAAIRVPKPGGSQRSAHQLSVRALARLHEVCQALAPIIDARLAPTVCGYRRGAEAGSAYSAEFQRYSQIATGFCAESEVVLAADVENFFAMVDHALLVDAVSDIAGALVAREVNELLAELRGHGVAGLAAGYSDMRMLANALLVQVDAVIDAPFVRWVDDYRIFLTAEDDAPAVAARVGDALAAVGLTLSTSKTRVWRSGEAARSLFARQFASVYHPGEEPAEMVRSALRSVFLEAVGQEQVKRRELRFALPRMAEVQDDLAVDFCKAALTEMPWEAPRFVGYLSAFAHSRPDLGPWTSDTLSAALVAEDDWLTVRLMPLAARVDLAACTLETTAAVAEKTSSRSVWSHCVRLLALHGRAQDVRYLVEEPADARAAVAALLDLGDVVPPSLKVGAGAITFNCSGGAPYPPPSPQSLL